MAKPKKCLHCKTIIKEPKPFQKACSPTCAIELVREKQRKEQKKKDRKRKEELKTKPELLKEAQYEFNKYIRLRDKGKPCISCGRMHDGQLHAGHYLSVGSTPELRFEESNCFSQCAPCNNHLSGNQINYRKRLIEKIGLDKVEWLEGPHEMPNWTHEDIREIKMKYRKKCKELEK